MVRIVEFKDTYPLYKDTSMQFYRQDGIDGWYFICRTVPPKFTNYFGGTLHGLDGDFPSFTIGALYDVSSLQIYTVLDVNSCPLGI